MKGRPTFSSRQLEMFPPTGSPLKLKLICMYLPNRLELSLRFVFAQPSDSSIEFDRRRIFFTLNEADRFGESTHGTAHKVRNLAKGRCTAQPRILPLYWTFLFFTFPLSFSLKITVEDKNMSRPRSIQICGVRHALYFHGILWRLFECLSDLPTICANGFCWIARR